MKIAVSILAEPRGYC